MNNAMDLEKLQCRLCFKTFKYSRTLSYHMNEHFINYTCERCGKGFATQNRYGNHLRSHSVGTFPCDECGKVFETKVRLEGHKSIHFKRLKCSHCTEMFKSMVQKRLHMRDVHAEPNKFPCPHCDATFIMPYYVTKHVKTHHSLRIRQYKCDQCDKDFYDKDTLERHAVVHTNKKDFLCTFCSKAFARKNNLNQHLKIHRDIRNFVCSHCGQDFIHKASLESHMRKHDKQIRDIQTNIMKRLTGSYPSVY